MKPTIEQCLDAVKLMKLVPFFPKEDKALQVIAASIWKFVNTVEELDWLTTTVCGHMSDWERGGGLPEIRGIFCTRFQPADGIVMGATSPGFSSADLEQQHEAEVRAENDRRLEEYRKKAELLAPEDRKPFELPVVKKIS